MLCYHFEENVRCRNETFSHFSYCTEHFDEYLRCPFTTFNRAIGRYEVCRDTVFLGNHFCKKHFFFFTMRKKRINFMVKRNYHFHKSHLKLDRTYRAIVEELYYRTKFYIENYTFPDKNHSCWMLYLVNSLNK